MPSANIFSLVFDFIASLSAESILSIIFAGGLFTYLLSIYSDSQKSLIDEYNNLLKEFSDNLDEVQDFATQYWAADGKNRLLEGRMRNKRAECERLVNTLNSKQRKFFQYDKIRKRMFRYFMTITGGKFENISREASAEKIDHAAEVLVDIKDYIHESRIPNNFKNRFCVKIK